MPRPEWLLMSAWDRSFCCPWCPHQAPTRPLLAEHKTRCPNRPNEEDPDGRE